MNRYLLLVICILQTYLTNAFTPKIVAGGLSYNYIAPMQYQLEMTFYANCNDSINMDSIPTMVCASSACGNQQIVYLQKDISNPNNGKLINVGCEPCLDSLNICDGYIYYNYKALVTLDTNCSDWIFQVNVNRPANISNLNTNSGGSLITTLNTTARPINNSVWNSQALVTKTAIFNPYFFVLGSSDSDNDSLFFQNQTPLDSSSFNLPPNGLYNIGYNFTNPLGTNTQFALDSNNGAIQFNAQQTGLFVHSVKISEYDQSTKQLIAISIKDYLIYVSPCKSFSVDFQNPQRPFISALTNTAFSTDTNSDVTFHANNNSGFEIKFKPKEYKAHKIITCNNVQAIGSNYTSSFIIDTDSNNLYSINFKWEPQLTDTGIHEIVFSIKDSMLCSKNALIEIPIRIKVMNFPLSIQSLNDQRKSFVFPNPTQYVLKYSQIPHTVSDGKLEIRNMFGQLVYRNTSIINSKEIDIDVSTLIDGNYFLHDKTNGNFLQFTICK
jgi:hypothetical protein